MLSSIPLRVCIYIHMYICIGPLYPFISQWTFRLCPCLGYYKQCRCEHWGVHIFPNHTFLRLYAQGPDCRITHTTTSVFWGASLLFSTVAAPIYIPPTVQEGFLSSTPSPAFVIYRLCDDGHSERCEVAPPIASMCIPLIVCAFEGPFMCFWPSALYKSACDC